MKLNAMVRAVDGTWATIKDTRWRFGRLELVVQTSSGPDIWDAEVVTHYKPI